MGRFPQGPHSKGSQRWLQWLVNEAPELLDQPIGLGPIAWRSPLRLDDYAEYRDQAFLDLLDIRLPTRALALFWPRGGPQWDGLGRAASGDVILVEAKAHLNELYSSKQFCQYADRLAHAYLLDRPNGIPTRRCPLSRCLAILPVSSVPLGRR